MSYYYMTKVIILSRNCVKVDSFRVIRPVRCQWRTFVLETPVRLPT